MRIRSPYWDFLRAKLREPDSTAAAPRNITGMLSITNPAVMSTKAMPSVILPGHRFPLSITVETAEILRVAYLWSAKTARSTEMCTPFASIWKTSVVMTNA